MWRKSKSMERVQIYERVERDFEGSEKDVFYYRLHDLITKDNIFSKLSYILLNRGQIGYFDDYLNLLKNFFIIPILFLWKIFLRNLECKYYKIKYQKASMFTDIKNEKFDYLFVINTRDHIITALPVLESLDDKLNSLVVTFKGAYARYKDDFDKLKNAKIILFEYELKNLPLTKYLRIIKESKNKFRLLMSQNLDSDLKQLIEIDKNFIKFHLKTELIQYYFFEKIFNAFDLKGAVSIVFTTAFELCKTRGIPTFVLQHGIGGKGHGHPYVSDYWFTFDDVSKESLDDWLDHTVNVLSLGSPRFEYLKDHLILKKDSIDFNKKIGKSGYKKIVTYIGGGAENQLTFQALKGLRKALPEYVNLIIKLHPRTPLNVLNLKKEMEKILTQKELEHTTFIRGEIDFYEILAHSDIVITGASTGMLEAIAVDIPTIQVNFTSQRYPEVYDLSSHGWKKSINDPVIMVKEVLSILSDKKRCEEVIEKQKWLKNRVFKNFGNCGKVITETIVNICNEKDERYNRDVT